MLLRHLAMEPLERRLMLAGDVSVQQKGGWLEIIGDKEGNQIQVERLEGNSYMVTGLDGERLLGAKGVELSNPVEIGDVTKGIKADLKQGDDTLVLIGNVTGDVSIKMGDGSDSVEIQAAEPEADPEDGDPPRSEITGKTTVDLGGNGFFSSVLIQDMNLKRDVSIKAGNAARGEEGEVVVELLNTDITGKLNVTTGNTADFVFLSQVNVLSQGKVMGNVTIKTGNGNDSVVVTGQGFDAADGVGEDPLPAERAEIGGKTTIDLGGNGASTAHLESIDFKGDVTIKAGNRPRGVEPDEEEGEFDVIDCTITGKLNVTTGNTNDYVLLWGTVVTSDVAIKTGDGTDWVDIWTGEDGEDGEDDEVLPTANGTAPYFIGGKLSVDIGNGYGGIWLGYSIGGDTTLRAGNAPTPNDDDWNYISVYWADLGGKLTINTGNGGWRVALIDADVAGDVSIATGSGDDEVSLWGGGEDDDDDVLFAATDGDSRGFGGNVTIKTGAGEDTVAAAFVSRIVNNLSIDTGNDMDFVALQKVEATGNVTVKTGNGDDVIVCAEVSANNVTLDSGNASKGGSDFVLFTNSPASVRGNLNITTGGGHDLVGIGQSDFIDEALEYLLDELPEEWSEYVFSTTGPVNVDGKLTVKTGSGNDQLAIGKGTFGGFVSIDTGGGKDECLIEGTEANGGASIQMGAGNADYLEIGDTTAIGTVKVDGGSGIHDELAVWGEYPEQASVVGFEIEPF
jgi:large repetitive protein